MEKKRYSVFRVVTHYDDCGRILNIEKKHVGDTFAASEKKAVNNVRFRERAGRKVTSYDGYGDSSIVRTYEAMLA